MINDKGTLSIFWILARGDVTIGSNKKLKAYYEMNPLSLRETERELTKHDEMQHFQTQTKCKLINSKK